MFGKEKVPCAAVQKKFGFLGPRRTMGIPICSLLASIALPPPFPDQVDGYAGPKHSREDDHDDQDYLKPVWHQWANSQYT